jgi:hypothetical protein
MTSPTTIKHRVSILVNGVTRLANEVFGDVLPVHAHHQHTELDHDDHLHYMTCAAGASRPFTGDVYWASGKVLRGALALTFDDYYRALQSTWTQSGMKWAETQADWSGLFTRFGHHSLLWILNSLKDSITASQGGETDHGALTGLTDDDHTQYHLSDGTRQATGDWDMDSHHIEGLTELIGQNDNGTILSRIDFSAQSTLRTAALHVDVPDVSASSRVETKTDSVLGSAVSVSATTGEESAELSLNGDLILGKTSAVMSAVNTANKRSVFSAFTGDGSIDYLEARVELVSGETPIGLMSLHEVDGAILAAYDPTSGFTALYGEAGISMRDSAQSGPGGWTTPFFLCQKSLAGKAAAQMEWSILRANAGSEMPLVEILNDLYSWATDPGGVRSITELEGSPGIDGGVIFESGNGLVITRREDGDGFRFDVSLSDLKYLPTSISMAIGTGTGDVQDIQILNDGSIYHVDEVTGVPGFDVRIGFSDVTAFDRVEARVWYHGTGLLHDVHAQLYNLVTEEWDDVGEFFLSSTYAIFVFALLSGTGPDYIDPLSHAVQFRFYHPDTGNAGHDFEVDFVALIQTAATAAAPTLQTAYNGGRTISASTGPIYIDLQANHSGIDISALTAEHSIPLLRLMNDSTVGAPSIELSGDASGNDFGHEIRTATRASLRSAFSVDSAAFDGYVSAYKDNAEYDISGVMVKADCDASLKNPAYINVEMQYSSQGRDKSLVDILGSDVFITGESGSLHIDDNEVTLTTESVLNLWSSEHVDLGDSLVEDVRNLSFSAVWQPAGTTTLTVDIASEGPYQRKAISANVTAVNITTPNGPQEFYIEIVADGTARTVTGFADGSVPIKWGCTVNPNTAAHTIAANSWAQFRFSYWGASIGYTAWVVEPAP